MLFTTNGIEINTNLSENSFEQLQNGTYKIGLFSDNPGINNDDNNTYYQTVTDDQNEQKRVFKNKVTVNLLDGNRINAHIIHWHPSRECFCITTSPFWNQFDTNNYDENIPVCPSSKIEAF